MLGEIMGGRGDRVPVSVLPNDGTFPTGTARWEKRNLAREIPVWDPAVCIQCGKCVMVCPHAVIRSKVYEAAVLQGAPSSFKSAEARLPDWKGLNITRCKWRRKIAPAAGSASMFARHATNPKRG